MAKGRELNHIEDLVTFYGAAGAYKALHIFENIARNNYRPKIKWDGKAAIYYGRDDNGEFCMGTKGNWHKNMPMYSGKAFHDYILSSGKGESWRQIMSKDFEQLFDIVKESVPEDFRGFVMGDLLRSPIMCPASLTSHSFSLKPNKVTYVFHNIDHPPRMRNAEVIFALHKVFDSWKGDNGTYITDAQVSSLQSKKVFLLGQTNSNIVSTDLLLQQIDSVRSIVDYERNSFDQINVRIKGLADLQNILYRYAVYSVKTNSNMNTHTSDTYSFMRWVRDDEKISHPKKDRIQSLLENNRDVLRSYFHVYSCILLIKHHVIDGLDDAISFFGIVNNKSGHEGYVCNEGSVKLVDRTVWAPD